MSSAPASSVPAPKPLLRGWLHLVCSFLAVPVAVVLVALATTPRGRVGAAVYAVGLVALFTVSGTYTVDAKGRPVLSPDLDALESETAELLIYVCEEVLDLGPEMPMLRALGVDVLRIAPRHEGTAEALAHYDLARTSPQPPPAIAARSGYWHGEAGMRVPAG